MTGVGGVAGEATGVGVVAGEVTGVGLEKQTSPLRRQSAQPSVEMTGWLGVRWGMIRRAFIVGLVCAGLGVTVAPARAQVLAQKNWAGSGVTVEVWWRRAVFYRIDPSKFQDSTGNGKGDLAGITQRLDYLQSLGVDAVILETAPEAQSRKSVTAKGKAAVLEPRPEVSADFDTLVRDAVGRHIRVLVELGAPASQQGDARYLAMARAWLNQGAAGIYVPTRAVEQVDGAEHIALLLKELRALTDGFPGERVLLADAPAEPDEVLTDALAKYTQMTASAPLGAADKNGALPTVAELRAAWMADLGQGSAASAPAASTMVTKTVKRTVVRHGRRHVVVETVRSWSKPRRSGASAVQNSLLDPLLVAARVPRDQGPGTAVGDGAGAGRDAAGVEGGGGAGVWAGAGARDGWQERHADD